MVAFSKTAKSVQDNRINKKILFRDWLRKTISITGAISEF